MVSMALTVPNWVKASSPLSIIKKMVKNYIPVIAGIVTMALAVFVYLDNWTAPVTESLFMETAQADLVGQQNLALALQANTVTLSSLQEQIEQLRNKVTSLETRGKSSTTRPQIAFPEDDQVLTVSDAIELEAEIEQAWAQVRAHFNVIETAFSSEPVDRPWSDAVSAQVEDAFTNVEALTVANARLDNLECRAQRCRLEVEFDDNENLEAAQAHLAFALVDEMPRMALTYEEDTAVVGRKKAIIYFARKDNSMLEK